MGVSVPLKTAFGNRLSEWRIFPGPGDLLFLSTSIDPGQPFSPMRPLRQTICRIVNGRIVGIRIFEGNQDLLDEYGSRMMTGQPRFQ
jgi:hypothetical protein